MSYAIPHEHGGQGGSICDATLIIGEMAQVGGITRRIAVEANIRHHLGDHAPPYKGAESDGRSIGAGGDKPAI